MSSTDDCFTIHSGHFVHELEGINLCQPISIGLNEYL